MRAIMVMYDTLNRHMLSPYGCDASHTPNFARLAERAATFDTCYVGSLPCMPARRELHTGRYNFLHRSWGPLEPFDDSMPEILKNNGVYSHLVTDHLHYVADGGATYHNRYATWELFRGQAGDNWQADLDFIPPPHKNGGSWAVQDFKNRQAAPTEADMPQSHTFRAGLDFIEKHHATDNWFLQLETFDPHEPFFCPEDYKALFPDDYAGPIMDWPPYEPVTETEGEIDHYRKGYLALLAMCDYNLGRVLDMMDRHDMWRDTMLIVNTDHGFHLGEHGYWAKCHMPFYNEVTFTPLFIWDPRAGVQGERRQSLVQTIDLAPTLLDFFGLPIPPDMQGHPLADTIRDDTPVREAGLFGAFAGAVNCTDGRYVYMRSPVPGNQPLYEYTLMPTRHGAGRAFIHHESLLEMRLQPSFSFTKGLQTLKLPSRGIPNSGPTALYDLAGDPQQMHPLDLSLPENQAIEARMTGHIVRLMQATDAPVEQYERLGLAGPKAL